VIPRRVIQTSVLLALFLLLPSSALAQEVRLLGPSVSLSSGYERTLLPLALRGAYGTEIAGRSLVLSLECATPMLSPGVNQLRTALGAEFDLLRMYGWMFRVATAVSGTTARNDAFYAVGFGAQIGATAGWQTRRWMAGLEAVPWLTAVTWLHTTAWAHQLGGSPLTSGYIWGSAAGVELGGRAGVLLTRNLEFSLRGGWERTGSYSLAVLPLYATLGVGVRW
jgi:hypothetical protein